MKKIIQRMGNLLLSLLVVLGLAVDASAVSRVDSREAVSRGGGNTAVYVLLGLAAAVLVTVAVMTVLKKKRDEKGAPAVVLSPAKPARRYGAKLEAQGTFLGGKHYGIVTHAMIGRSSSADIRVDDPAVSGAHCQVSWENGKLFLMDMDSTNGTVLAGTGKIRPKTRVQLYNGSVFWLGDQRMSFRVHIQ